MSGRWSFVTAVRSAIVSALFSVPSAGLVAQSPPAHWLPGTPASGPAGVVAASTWWDPDGVGPLPQVLVVGGDLQMTALGAANLLCYEPGSRQWTACACQPNGPVTALTTLADGRLAIAGGFTAVSGQSSTGLVLYDGITSTSVPCGLPAGSVGSMLQMPGGDLVVGGDFQQIGGQAIHGLARWDGAQWNAYPFVGADITALALRANGHLLVGGAFAGNVAEWNAPGWTTLAPGIGGSPRFLLELSNGNVVAGGTVGVPVGLWNGATWLNIGTPLSGSILDPTRPSAALELSDGSLVVAPALPILGVGAGGVMRWDGSQWSVFAPGLLAAQALRLAANGDLLVAGPNHESVGLSGVGIWDGSTWHAAWDGFDIGPTTLTATGAQSLLALGPFEVAGGVAAHGAARFDGQSWSALTFPSPSTVVGRPICAAAAPAIGWSWIGFSDAGVLASAGASWFRVSDIHRPRAILPDGTDIYVGCEASAAPGPRIAHVTGFGSVTTPLGADLDGSVLALLRHSSGDLIAGGSFVVSGTTAVSRVARWNGVAWQSLGVGLDGTVRALAELPNGDIVAGGDFRHDGALQQTLSCVARWDGQTWHPLGAGLGGVAAPSVAALQLLPSGDLVAAGNFAPGNLARWDGVAWSSVDGGVDGPVRAMVLARDLVVAGDFGHAGSQESPYVARLRSVAAAGVDSSGTPCAGSYGPAELLPMSMPWLGAIWRTRCLAAPGAIGIDVLGLTTMTLSLAALLPTAVPGCQLLVTPDVTELRATSTWQIDSAFAVPNDPALIARTFHHQVVQLQPANPQLFIPEALLASNRLTWTIGDF